MASFEELIKIPSFKDLFVKTGIFESFDKLDLDVAEALWAKRFPVIDWGVCSEKKCFRLTMEGQNCRYHRKHGEQLPKFAWDGVNLYFLQGSGGYRQYSKMIAEQYVGSKISKGYGVWAVDGNPFNLRIENLAILSEIAIMTIKNRLLPVPKALEMDNLIAEIIAQSYRSERTASLRWQYGLQDVADATGMAPGSLKRRLTSEEKKSLPLHKIVSLAIEKRFGIRSI